MMSFGGALTLNGLIGYIATNLEKALLGRYWGIDDLGLYGRAFQLISIPTENVNTAAGEVAFAALSRVQDEPARLKNYFLKGYSLVLALTVPLTIICALFADDIIAVLLGAKWSAAAPIFRFLAPTVLVFAIGNPIGWLLISTGRVGRSVKMSLVSSPIMIAAYCLALPYGPKGVALAYSGWMLLWILPAVAWAVHGTGISLWDILLTAKWPMLSGVVAAVLAFGASSLCGHFLPSLARLILEVAVMLPIYFGMLFFATGQKAFYLDLYRGMIRPENRT